MVAAKVQITAHDLPGENTQHSFLWTTIRVNDHTLISLLVVFSEPVDPACTGHT